jgi:hypothetical protein
LRITSGIATGITGAPFEQPISPPRPSPGSFDLSKEHDVRIALEPARRA